MGALLDHFTKRLCARVLCGFCGLCVPCVCLCVCVVGNRTSSRYSARHWKSLRPVLDMLGAREAKARRLGAPIVTGYFAVVLVMSVVPVLSSLTRGT